MPKKIILFCLIGTFAFGALFALAQLTFAATSTARIDSPANNAEVSGSVELRGTAAGPDFHYYKVEFSFPGSDAWVLVGNTIHYESVTNGMLATFDTTKIPDGAYALRLLAADKNGQYNTDQIIVAVNNTAGAHAGKGPERGCMACHVQQDAATGFPTLYWEAQYATDNMHPPLANGFNATYDECMTCHAPSGVGDKGVGAPLSMRAIAHPAHSFSKIFTEIEYNGNCFSCHNVTADGKWDVIVDAMLVNEKGVPLSIKATPTVIPPAPPALTPTPDPAIYNQVPDTKTFEPGQCSVILNQPAPAYTSNTLALTPSGEIPSGKYEVGVAAKYSTSLWYGLNNVGAANYINSTSAAALEGDCEMSE